MLSSRQLLHAVDSVAEIPAKVSVGRRVVWRLTACCRDRHGVVTEVIETIVHRQVVFSYVIELDPIVVEGRQLISKYGSAIAENTKVLCSEEEMWKDGASSATKLYLEGSIVDVYESNSARGTMCFYAIKLDSVRAVDDMLRDAHPFDLYSHAYDSQAMLWQNDVDSTLMRRTARAAAIDAAVVAAAKQECDALQGEETRKGKVNIETSGFSGGDPTLLNPLSFEWEHYSSPRSQPDSEYDYVAHTPRSARVSAKCVTANSILGMDPLISVGCGNIVGKEEKYHEKPLSKTGYVHVPKLRWRQELHHQNV